MAVSIGSGIGTDNEFFLNHVYTQTRDVPDYGISFLNKRPVDTTVATGKIDDETFFGGDKTLMIAIRALRRVFLRINLAKIHNYAHSYALRIMSAPIGQKHQVPPQHQRQRWAMGGNPNRVSDYETLTFQSDFNTKLDLANMPHELLAGVEYFDEDSFRHGLRNLGTATDQYIGVASW